MSIKNTIRSAAPDILICVGIGGIVTATVLAVEATDKAKILIDERRKELNTYKLSFKEKVKTVWKCYIPSFSVGMTAAGAIIGARTIEAKRTAGAVAACRLAERLGDEYQKKVVETIGEKKEKAIQEAVCADEVATHPVTVTETTRQGLTYFYDPYNERFVWANRDSVLRAESWLQKSSNDYNVTLSEWFDAAGVEPTNTTSGLWTMTDNITVLSQAVGWQDPSEIEVDISGLAITDPNGVAATVIRFKQPPKYLERW